MQTLFQQIKIRVGEEIYEAFQHVLEIYDKRTDKPTRHQ